MLTTTPHLYIRRPSPTTAEFTVTTCPPLNIWLRFLLLLILLLRVATITAATTTIYARFYLLNSPSSSSSSSAAPPVPPLTLLFQGDIFPLLESLLFTLHTSPAGQALFDWVRPVPSWALLLSCSLSIYVSLFAQLHTTESLLVLRGLGIQTSTSSGGLTGRKPKTRFIPTEKIRDVLINEAFRGFEVRYYLIVIVEGEEDVVVVFPKLLPRKRIVQEVWRGVRGCLFEGDGTVGGYGHGHGHGHTNGGNLGGGGNKGKDGGGGGGHV